ncbi:DNA-packaging protein [Bradyrhizobium guangdongense]|uniref:ATP-binding protein n=1 Tax=Bradyrhizobium guangdongense TaxID=1325090 RepID=A0A410V7D1_9BRAD|nr:terminase family protein [Bradyrhizobium guangdongense]QAU39589.1 ATP-binding protein [Bradyrhizobium guangdongense]QOZ60650.1 ATP-binding protein [Bradyrhizobium guangdongense]GGI24135.1 large terminase [Bradyrhizobium guangdongense]
MQPSSVYGQLAAALQESWRMKARPEQLPPKDWTGDGRATGWLALPGRGWGKTWVGANVVNEMANTVSRIALIGATASDVRDTMIEGESGVLRTAPNWFRPSYEPSKRKLEWPNGATALAFSAEESERLRGPQFSFLWGDEACAWENAQQTWDMAQFGLRIGSRPRWLITSTPRPTKFLRDLLAREGHDVVVSRGSTFANAKNLAPSFLEAIEARYGGTRLGRQEIEGEVLTDTPGALWQMDWLDRDRVSRAPELRRIVVAIDPAISTNEGSDETGIIVVGIGGDRHGYVLEDLSGRYQPHEWATIAVAAYSRHKADRIVGEKNQGGDMVQSTIRMVDPNVSFKPVHASKGKFVRAEPVSALYEQRKVHHVGSFPQLEDQLCTFTSDFDRGRSGYSPDRLDALVWGLSELMVTSPPPMTFAPPIVFTRPRDPFAAPHLAGGPEYN